jgi:hypothetical protein
MQNSMQKVLLICFSMGAIVFPVRAQVTTVAEACSKFAAKLTAAQQAGDIEKAQLIFQIGSQRIASNFNGATCSNVKPPSVK